MSLHDRLRQLYFLVQRLKYRAFLWNKNILWGRGVRIYPRVAFKVAARGLLELGDDIRISQGTYLLAEGEVRVGKRTLIGNNCILASLNSIEIGDDCLIAHMVSIRDHEHDLTAGDIKINEQGFKETPVRIGDNVWIGDKVTVTSGVTIGSNSVIGANAVVTKDIPANVIAAGVPARIIRKRDEG